MVSIIRRVVACTRGLVLAWATLYYCSAGCYTWEKLLSEYGVCIKRSDGGK